MNDKLREALEKIKYKAESLADAQVIALEALAASKQEPQAQAGDPEVVAWIGVFKDAKGNPRKLPLEHRPDEGTQLALLGAKFFPLITLQSHREAMAVAQNDYFKLSCDFAELQGAVAKKDAALNACVTAHGRLKAAKQRLDDAEAAGSLTQCGQAMLAISIAETALDAAITQAEEAMK